MLDLSYSSNLYRTPVQGELYRAAVETREYRRGVRAFLERAESHGPALWRQLAKPQDSPIMLVDCGPGETADGVAHLRRWSSATRIAEYIAVDVNSRLLDDVVATLARRASCPVRGILSAFEDLRRSRISSGELRAMFLLGSTCMNFEVAELADLLARMTRPGDHVMLTVMTANEDQGAGDLKPYDTEQVERFVFEPIRMSGGERGQFVKDVKLGSRGVECWFVATEEVTLLSGQVVLGIGGRVLAAFSRRPTRVEHEQEMRGLFCASVADAIGTRGVVTVGER